MSANLIKWIAVTILLGAGLSATAIAAVPNTLGAGTPARASDLNDNFTDLDERLTTLEAIHDEHWNFGGYWLDFSAVGAPSNVLVLGRYDSSDSLVGYLIRVGNGSGGQVSVNGSSTTRQFVFHYGFVSLDPEGMIDGIDDFIESPDTKDYVTYLLEDSSYDPNTLEKTVNLDIERATDSCGNSTVQICVSQISNSSTGAFIRLYDYSRGRVLATDVDIGGGWPVFADVRVEKNLGGSHRLRIRARGIGNVFNTYDGGNYDRLLYYRKDGATGGSLAGTPVESGGALEGLFFTP